MHDILDLIDIILIVYIVREAYMHLQNVLNNNRRYWVRELYQDRDTNGFFAVTFKRIKENDPEQFKIATRMKSETFDVLFNLLEPHLTKNSIRTPIGAECRLFLTLV